MTTSPTLPQAADRLDLLQREPSLQRLLQQHDSDSERLSLFGLRGSANALCTALLAAHCTRPLLVVVANQNRVYELVEDLAFFRSWLGLQTATDEILPFPHIETLPYEHRDPQMDIRSERARVRQWLAGELPEASPRPVLVAPVRSVMRRLPPAELARTASRKLTPGTVFDREEFSRLLVDQGYEYRELVSSPGHFAVRGGIFDVYPVAASEPYRIELWGDEIDSIRVFDPSSQRSTGKREALVFFPSAEHSLGVRHIAEGGTLERVVDALPADTLVVVDDMDEVATEAEKVEALVRKMYNERQQKQQQQEPAKPQETEDFASDERELELPLVEPETLWEPAVNVVYQFLEHARVILERRPLPEGADAEADNIKRTMLALDCMPAEVMGEEVKDRLATPLRQAARGEAVSVICDNQGQVERLRELLTDLAQRDEELNNNQVTERIDAGVGQLHEGFGLPAIQFRLYTDRELFHRYKRFRAQKFTTGEPIADIVDLKPGDHVVHLDHGIARYVGLANNKDESNPRKEFLELRFADEGVLYVPLEQMELVGRYVGTSDEAPQLSKLGSKVWSNAKARARKAIEDMADELLELYAQRQVAAGHAFSEDTAWQHEFEASFVYTETPDQLRSIEEVKEDMEADKPMDRLLCGDVGFGKTEVAIRAAFKAVLDGYQAAVLVPTTVLAEQHYRTLSERMADYPVRVELLSRFRTTGEAKEVLADAANGEVDILVGTHKILGKDVRFHNLGLVIIDEEQRFGVKHKERLKQLRRETDVLALSATPIPRTLYMSMSGIRDMSVVNTPPRDRLPIETYVLRWNREKIESAVLRELSRGGQVFFVHNEVRTIYSMAHMLQEIVPDARICVGHGQMAGHELEQVMKHFVGGDYDVLVSTTIIENGIDIPNVNTIIINNADRFGLAQLYQMRGRVGRSHHQAYCYLFVRDTQSLTTEARRRLRAIQEFNELGAGFQVALRDLEIRGMGNVLGKQQSGHIAAIGFDLYNQMLRDTVKTLRTKTSAEATGQPVYDAPANISVALGAPALIPPEYVPSGKQRMALHKRFSKLDTEADVLAMREEIEDLYGQLPPEVERLFDEMRIKLLAREAGVCRIKADDEGIYLQFNAWRTERFDPREVLALDQQRPGQVKLRQHRQTIGIELPPEKTFASRVQLVGEILRKLKLQPESPD